MEFDPYSSDFFNGAFETYRWLRDEAPVYFNEKYDFWALSRYEDVNAAYKDWETYSSAQGIMLDQLSTPGFTGAGTMPGYLGVYDPPEHSRLRKLSNQAFTPRAVTGLMEATQRAAVKHLEPLADRASFDFIEDFAKLFPAEVVYDLMGVPEADRQYALALFDKYMCAGEEGDENAAFNAERMQAMGELHQYFMGLVREKRKNPADDIISRVCTTSFIDDDGVEQRLSESEAGAYLLQLVSAGVETTTKLMGACLVGLQRNPAEWQKIVDDRGKIPAALEEAGRLEAPVQFIGRKTTRDVTLHGVTIPDQSNVLLMMGAANRDDRIYENPEVMDIDRTMPRAPLTFGFGPHACAGTHLARLEGKIAFNEVLDRFPTIRIDEANLVRVRGFHVFGWASVPVTVSQPAVAGSGRGTS